MLQALSQLPLWIRTKASCRAASFTTAYWGVRLVLDPGKALVWKELGFGLVWQLLRKKEVCAPMSVTGEVPKFLSVSNGPEPYKKHTEPQQFRQ